MRFIRMRMFGVGMSHILIIPAEEYALWLACIPIRHLRTDDNAPAGRLITNEGLARAMTARERYLQMKLRRKGMPEYAIKKAIADGDVK